jgi:hypothetical protein
VWRIELADSCARIFGETEGYVVRLGIAANVSERQDSDKDLLLGHLGGPKPAVNAERDGAKNRERKQGDGDALPYRRRRGFDGNWNRDWYHGIAVSSGGTGFNRIRIGDKRRVGLGIINGLALLEPSIQFTGVGVYRGFFLVLVTMDGKAFGSLPALYGADFSAEMRGYLFPGSQFLVWKG